MLCFDEKSRVYFTRAPERQLANAPEVDFTRLIFLVKSHQIESIHLSIRLFLCVQVRRNCGTLDGNDPYKSSSRDETITRESSEPTLLLGVCH